jgi:isoquinoline 1-oxidoreductase subunit alpha
MRGYAEGPPAGPGYGYGWGRGRGYAEGPPVGCCGVGLCGACMVHIDGKRAFSCQTQVSEVAGKQVTTIEGLSPDSSHPVQKAWLAERVPQCGYCQSGQIMSAADLLMRKPHPTRAEIIEQMSA